MKSARTLALGVAVVAVLSLATPAAAHADTSPLPCRGGRHPTASHRRRHHPRTRDSDRSR